MSFYENIKTIYRLGIVLLKSYISAKWEGKGEMNLITFMFTRKKKILPN